MGIYISLIERAMSPLKPPFPVSSIEFKSRDQCILWSSTKFQKWRPSTPACPFLFGDFSHLCASTYTSHPSLDILHSYLFPCSLDPCSSSLIAQWNSVPLTMVGLGMGSLVLHWFHAILSDRRGCCETAPLVGLGPMGCHRAWCCPPCCLTSSSSVRSSGDLGCNVTIMWMTLSSIPVYHWILRS